MAAPVFLLPFSLIPAGVASVGTAMRNRKKKQALEERKRSGSAQSRTPPARGSKPSKQAKKQTNGNPPRKGTPSQSKPSKAAPSSAPNSPIPASMPVTQTRNPSKTSEQSTEKLRQTQTEMADERPRDLNEEQVAEFKEAFALFDKDNDGFVSVKEFGTVLRSLGVDCGDAEINDIASEMKVDAAKGISFNEFLRSMSRMMKNVDNADEIREAFKTFDKDASGFITVAELRHIMTNLGNRLSEDEVNAMVKEADVKGDGKVNYDQFIQAMMSD